MATIDQQYVNHLRKNARPSETLTCVLCRQPVPITGKQSYSKHLDSIHSADVEQSSKDPNFDRARWQQDLELQSRAAASSTPSVDQANDKANRGQSENTQAMRSLTLDSTKKTGHRKIAPARTDQRPRGDPGGHKRSRSSDDHNQRGPTRQSKTQNPRRATAKVEDQESPDQLNRASTFKSNWGRDGQPTRQLFNPADGPPPPTAPASSAQATLPSRVTGPPSEIQQGATSMSASQPSQSAQGTQVAQERGILPMPTMTSTNQHARERPIVMPIDPRWPDMLLQPDSRPISQEQLAAEVKSIYSGLTMVESKCIHVDKAQALAMREGDARISNDHWQALIALHKTLLHEHHDFFLASQHPSASPALRRLASKYSMPARMWKHGIHSFLELLRYRLPESLEFMISFIYTAYQMMSLLYETVPAFQNTWIECLGDLGRYRMAIEDEDIRDRENWTNVSKFWYTKAADNTPYTGRLYHHLAILARPNALQQLSLYARSLISEHIFANTRESILTLFNPFLGRSDAVSHISPLDTFFVKAHALLFSKEQPDEFKSCQESILELLDQHIGRVTAKWREQGAWMIIALMGALFDYGNDSPLRRAYDTGFRKLNQQVRARAQTQKEQVFDPQQPPSSNQDAKMEDVKDLDATDDKSRLFWDMSRTLVIAITTLVLRRQGDKNVLPYVHIWLAFLLSLTKVCSVDEQINASYVTSALRQAIPRRELCCFLNTLSKSDTVDRRYEIDAFVQPEKGEAVALPEDYLIRGQVWSQDYFPVDMFKSNHTDDEEKNIEHASTVRVRAERVLNVAYRLSKRNIGIRYESSTKTFSYDEADATALAVPMSISEDVTMSGSQFTDLGESVLQYDFEDDTDENKQLEQNLRGRSDQVASGDHLSVPTQGGLDLDAIMKTDLTYLVCDEQLMLNNQDIFKLLVKRRWTIILPHQVLAGLTAKSRTDQPVKDTAVEALEQIKSAYQVTNIQILNPKGEDTTQKHFGAGDSPACKGDSSPGSPVDNQESLLGVTRRATDLSLSHRNQDETTTSLGNITARPAILLTEDRTTRAMAKAEKLAALAPTVLRKYLEPAVTRLHRSLSRSSESRPDVGSTTPPAVLSPDGLQGMDSKNPDQLMETGP